MRDEPQTINYETPSDEPRTTLYGVVLNVLAAVFLFALAGVVGIGSLIYFGMRGGFEDADIVRFACLFGPLTLIFLAGGFISAHEARRMIQQRRAERFRE